MIFSDITIIDENFAVREHCYVGVKDETIAYVGAAEPKEDFGSVYSGRGKLLMPAFYNAHTHSAMTLLRGYA
ncbi:MAG: amidohydrolase, partial [Firmicutes bacterium]|nr:amidohydrolase [Bacillota bacterium]MBQ1476148.1 amidohydrolase [Bacillota bacterium]